MKDEKVNVNANVEVTGKEGKYLTVDTIAVDRKGNEYRTQHYMKNPKAAKLTIGKFAHIEGHLDMDENGINYIDPLEVTVLEEALEDMRMNAWITAEASSNFIEPKSLDLGKTEARPFGVATVKVGNRYQRGIVFNNLIATFRKNLKAGALIRLAGRIQYRSFEKDGVTKTIAEIICDNSYTEVLKASTKKNPFAFSKEEDSGVMAGFKKAEAIPESN